MVVEFLLKLFFLSFFFVILLTLPKLIQYSVLKIVGKKEVNGLETPSYVCECRMKGFACWKAQHHITWGRFLSEQKNVNSSSVSIFRK